MQTSFSFYGSIFSEQKKCVQIFKHSISSLFLQVSLVIRLHERTCCRGHQTQGSRGENHCLGNAVKYPWMIAGHVFGAFLYLLSFPAACVHGSVFYFNKSNSLYSSFLFIHSFNGGKIGCDMKKTSSVASFCKLLIFQVQCDVVKMRNEWDIKVGFQME